MAKATASLPRYTVIIQWSPEDDCYVASLPEWGPGAKTHGDTYEEAAKNAGEVLELLIEHANEKAARLPREKHFHYPGADVIDLPDEAVDRKISGKKPRKSA
jgi:antitoxin HicB